jgi:hypothetical protein
MSTHFQTGRNAALSHRRPQRQVATSHRVYRMPWQGDPRVNKQNAHGKAKTYQVRQVLKAIERLYNETTEQ